MNKKIKWGVIGSGGIAKRRTIPEGIIPASNAELFGVFDTNTNVNHEVANEFGVTAYDSVKDLLESDIEVVYVSSPVGAHLEQVKAVAAAGKHIFSEKPLGLSVLEAVEMVETCRAAGVKLGIGYMMRFHAQHRELKRLVDVGDIGKPVYGRAQLSCWYPLIEGDWRQNPEQSGGGALMDMGSHCIDLLEMFFGKVKQLSCFTGNLVHNYKSEDSAVVLMKFESGAMATVDAFFCIPDSSSKNVLELYGSGGSVLAKETIGQGVKGEMIAYLENSDLAYDPLQDREAKGGRHINPDPSNMYLAEVEEFSAAIMEGREPVNNGDLALHSQKVLAACYKSSSLGAVVAP